MTGSYDPELDLLYWGTGNPGPDWNGEVREGDNLHSDSVLAIRPDTGEIVWAYSSRRTTSTTGMPARYRSCSKPSTRAGSAS